ncbi:MAG: hypothetical protein D8M57_19340 [Candidatus Scalindua sp. AMX11]|nr:MAG: hypothetical protein DWQ00_02500 [Candidatus Scalindua sp.]TDE63240.1 MAG: hypothetical protein D8M57_19340 [Candidatus Scalindua sp. AMX11]
MNLLAVYQQGIQTQSVAFLLFSQAAPIFVSKFIFWTCNHIKVKFSFFGFVTHFKVSFVLSFNIYVTTKNRAKTKVSTNTNTWSKLDINTWPALGKRNCNFDKTE